MKRHCEAGTKIVQTVALLAALCSASMIPSAHAANSRVALAMDNFAAVKATGAVAMTPNQADFEAGHIAQNSAITLTVLTNAASGCTVSISAAPNSSLKASDLLIKSTATGTDTGFTTYNAVTNNPQTLWSNHAALPDGTVIALDVKVQNLRGYLGATSGAGRTVDYANTLTFTVLPNA